MNDSTLSPVLSARTSSQHAWLEVRDISKHYGGVYALDGVSLAIRRGFVHGLIGANGAGKSTLVRCLAGVVSPDSGEVFIEGKPVVIADPHDASGLGLAFIHQEVSLVPGFDVFRNMTLGIAPQTRLGVIDWRSLRRRAEGVRTRLAMRFPLSADIDDLSTADQWLVLIGRALMRDAVLIAMDEPTASLSAVEVERVHSVVRDLVANDVAVIYVSHRLDEVVELCDDITVFRDGKVVSRATRGEVTKPDLVRAIVGRDVVEAQIPESQLHGRVVLDVKGVSDKKLLRNVSLSVHEGEVLGLAGLVGAGRTELAKIIYGESHATAGEVRLNGKKTHFREPADAAAAGIGFVPEERRSEAVFADRSIAFNITISSLAASVVSRWLPLLRPRHARIRASKFAKEVTVNTADMRQLIGSLSGGNQQKAVIARWLARSTSLLILDEPSRGVDVGARFEIHRVIRELAAKGTAILAISSDVEELVGLCDRVIVMVEGRVHAELKGSEITTERMIALSFTRKDERQ
ncbi:MAG TPA: sugar ABC transporter ATP-binding protein [Candidatus Nanopelagicaceae bacterium]|nr:sugar ABC transporter ATP-binding protein [Candidatus Nanopelagicaceae bacterium]